MAVKKTKEDKNIEYLETRYCYEKRQKIYVANEETNQIWDETDVPDFINAWNNGWALNEISDYLGADQWEITLLALDLIKNKKIKGNVHIFKPKRKLAEPMEIILADGRIRVVKEQKETWVCLKDIWKWIDKPDHSYRKVTEGWGPDKRAKYKLPTAGGPQSYIFINIQGLSDLYHHVEKNQIEKLNELKEALKNV